MAALGRGTQDAGFLQGRDTLPSCDSVDKAQDGPAAPCLLPPHLQVPPEVWEREPGEGDEL